MILRKYLCFACAVLFIQSGYAKEQKPINLGETPWRFSKVVRQEMDLAKDARILCGTQAVPVINDGDMNTEWVANDAPDQVCSSICMRINRREKSNCLSRGTGYILLL